jgi:hypothetical protein
LKPFERQQVKDRTLAPGPDTKAFVVVRQFQAVSPRLLFDPEKGSRVIFLNNHQAGPKITRGK